MIRRVSMFALWLALSFAPATQAADPVLILLEHVENGRAVQTKIELKAGVVVSPDKAKPFDRWILRPGDALRSNVRPNDRVVQFYRITGGENQLLFMVNVRYYPGADGAWIPQFQLNEEPLVVRGPDGRWKPLTVIQGVPSLIVQTGSALPNAEGFKNSIELGFTTGPTPIDAWLVQ